jgi:periplasmic divalent cation tolerance protein
MEGEFVVVFCTFPDLENARRVIAQLVESKLIACGNIFPGVESIYRWKGQVERSGEVFAVLKTTSGTFSLLASKFKELHPYEVPELVAAQIAHGLPEYLAWIAESVSSGGQAGITSQE